MIRQFTLKTPQGTLLGHLERPKQPCGLVLVARIHNNARDDLIAAGLAGKGYATLSMGLLTAREVQFVDAAQNVPRLAQRLLAILDRLRDDGDTEDLLLALYAAGDVTPAAIRVAARRDMQVRALICHGGQIDRAGRQALALTSAPLLMLLDAGNDLEQAAFHRARPHLRGPCSEQILTAGEDATPHIAAWLFRGLKTDG
jgi:hypothetical protein